MQNVAAILGFLLCTAYGFWEKYKTARQKRIWSDACETAGQLLFDLQSCCMSTPEILMQLAGQSDNFFSNLIALTLNAVDAGTDLYEAWERELRQIAGISVNEKQLLRKMVGMLGSLDLMGSCAAYEGLLSALRQKKEQAEQKDKIGGTAAVKVGLLCGLGVGLLLWKG